MLGASVGFADDSPPGPDSVRPGFTAYQDPGRYTRRRAFRRAQRFGTKSGERHHVFARLSWQRR